jgi:hypothetical protein
VKRLKVYRKIYEQNKILGLEFPDFLILVLLYLAVFLFSKNLILNLVLIGGAHFFLRLYKKGKPPHWTVSILRFLFRGRRYGQTQENSKEIKSEKH